MDRRALLSKLKKLVFMNELKADDIRLYILLLTNCIGSRNGAIDYGTIKNAIGREFSTIKLKKACQRLVNHKLINITSSIPVGTTEEEFTICYMICADLDN